MEAYLKLKCYCRHHCPDGGTLDGEGTCEVELGGRCFAAAEEVINTSTGLLEPEYSYGCFSPGDPAFLQCKGHLVDHVIPTSIACCDSDDFCNQHLRPIYKPSNSSDHLSPFPPTSDYYILQLLLGVVVTLLLITFFVILYIVCKYRAREKSSKYSDKSSSFLLSTSTASTTTGSTSAPTSASSGFSSAPSGFTSAFSAPEQSSGSGSGLPLLVQRTVGRQITLRQRLGKGRFGEIHLADWGGTLVAVKTFPTHEESAWLKEKSIYKLSLIKHPNLLVAMAWDIRSAESVTQMILIIDYHPLGSIYDFLQSRTLTEPESLRLILSALAGLTHLHAEVEGHPYKPGIAHRDLKSKNILVKSNGEACIGDFGLAVCSVSGQKTVETIPNIRVGSPRFQAPEVLDESINTRWFEAFKQADLYSFALILWEVGSRTRHGPGQGQTPYQIPYFEHTSAAEPSREEMRELVCRRGIRPSIPESWSNSPMLNTLSRVISECWHRNPQVRLPILRARKTLMEAAASLPLQPPPTMTSSSSPQGQEVDHTLINLMSTSGGSYY